MKNSNLRMHIAKKCNCEHWEICPTCYPQGFDEQGVRKPVETPPSREALQREIASLREQVVKLTKERDEAVAAWNRRASPASAPVGFVLVPVEPTQEMLDAMFETRKIAPDDADLIEQYNALLAAAPTPPVSEDRKDAERFRFLLEDHTKRETRQRIMELLERLPVMSLSAASAAIDALKGE